MSSPTVVFAIAIICVVILTVVVATRYIEKPETKSSEDTSENSSEPVQNTTNNTGDLPDDDPLPAKLALLTLIDEHRGGPIKGQTRIQKLTFLLQEEWEEYSDEPYPFEKYEFKPENY